MFEIDKVAQETGLTKRTIRYYEELVLERNDEKRSTDTNHSTATEKKILKQGGFYRSQKRTKPLYSPASSRL
ncbi:MerR family transcriptional regulator [Paenibacillus sp. PK4536]|uniref:MerR family transcriptional regulator n=1 Tax=Paenibacillus sp. PK4536 TaxID=3024576 RepID=UPI00235A08BF|nr:MerR family transcriptional regulator [Paenibacillus sp. PK4536]WIM39183.1 MerR family transcriptional regulator [Paenibacillus sp. PK4536]